MDPILASLLLTLYILTEQSHPCLCLHLPTKSLYFHFRPCCNHCLNERQHHLSRYKTQIYGSHLRFIYLPYIPAYNQSPCPKLFFWNIFYVCTFLSFHLPKSSHAFFSSGLKQFYGFTAASYDIQFIFPNIKILMSFTISKFFYVSLYLWQNKISTPLYTGHSSSWSRPSLPVQTHSRTLTSESPTSQTSIITMPILYYNSLFPCLCVQ